MTDNEIKKAFEYCTFAEDCADCPLFKNCPSSFGISQMALDLINRLEAEIERLQKENNQFADIGKMYSEIKAEAIKEFAERLKPRIDCEYGNKFYRDKCYEEIDNLVKERLGDAE